MLFAKLHLRDAIIKYPQNYKILLSPFCNKSSTCIGYRGNNDIFTG